MGEVVRLNPHSSLDTALPTASMLSKRIPEVAHFRADLRKAGLK